MVMGFLRHKRWLVALLVLSLAGNVFLGGLYAGAWLGDGEDASVESGEKGGESGRHPGQRIFKRMAEALPEADRATFEAAVAGQREALATAGLAMQEARNQVRAQFKAEPFDRAALDAAFADMRAKSQAFWETLHGVMAGAVAALSPEGRKKLSEMEWRGRGRSR